jgi:starch phosphorylase
MYTHGTIAYFSMEIALETGMPTYSGGLGVLAGDTIRAAADLKVPMVAVTLLHRKGYFYQRLDAQGWQTEEPAEWVVEDFVEEMPQRVSVTVEGRLVQLRCWRYDITGVSGFTVPVYLLDADLPDNTDWDRTLTHFLYGGDQRYRLCQEVLLGIGGVRMLRALGYDTIARFHLNEGHASLLTLELLDEELHKAGRLALLPDDIDAVRGRCLFTTHTPVPAGHDQFPLELVTQVLARQEIVELQEVFCCDGVLNMTYLALNLSHYVNGVTKNHGAVSQHLFAGYVIDSITNGVHAATWTAPPFQALYDRYIPGWRQDNFNLRYALSIPKPDVWQAHLHAKKQLLHYVNHETNAGMEVDVLTLGFARRAATYKRADLLFTDLERIRHIAAKARGVQVIYAGKAHPQDREGKALIPRIFQAKELLKRDLKVVYLENYDMELGRLMTAGVDVWLNTPQPPLEASGTSGMKAALNGVPSLSVLDGWWIEGRIEGVTGWAIGDGERQESDRSRVVSSLYDKLELVILPLFYQERERFIDVMVHTIALNGSFFNTHRMIQQYVLKAYF